MTCKYALMIWINSGIKANQNHTERPDNMYRSCVILRKPGHIYNRIILYRTSASPQSPFFHSPFYDLQSCDTFIKYRIVKSGQFYVSMITINGNAISTQLKTSTIQTYIHQIRCCHFDHFEIHSSFAIKILLMVSLKKNF